MSLATRRLGPTGTSASTGISASTGAPDRAPRRLVLAHGFTQNVDCWGRFAERLAEHHELVLVDAPGHGNSYHDDADLWAAGDLLAEAGGRGIYVGYSMGGRAALHTALAHPDLVEGLVLIGATPGLVDADDRAERRRADGALADRLLADGLPAFLDRWLDLPLFAGLDDAAAARPARERNRPEGLAASLRHCGTGSQDPLWDRLGELTAPVLAVVGAQDHKFGAIAERMVAGVGSARDGAGPGADVLVLPGTHAVHLERPDRCADAILERLWAW